MKTKLLYLFTGLVAFTFAACEQETVADEDQSLRVKTNTNENVTNSIGVSPCIVANLMAGQNHDSGDLSVTVDLNNVYVQYATTGNWFIKKTHLYAGSLQLLPRNNSGNPIPGQFPISTTFNPLTQSITYTIPKTNLPECFTIAAHAEVQRIQNGIVLQTETAWADGVRFSTKNWATYFNACQSDCFDIEDYYFGKQ